MIALSFSHSNKAELHQRVVQLIGILRLRPGLFADALDRGRIQPAQIRSCFCVEKAAIHHRQGAPLFGRGIVEKSVGLRGQDFLGQRRRLSHLPGDQFSLAAFD